MNYLSKFESADEVITKDDVLKIFCISAVTLRFWRKTKGFPAPLKIRVNRRTAYVKAEVYDWFKNNIRGA